MLPFKVVLFLEFGYILSMIFGHRLICRFRSFEICVEFFHFFMKFFHFFYEIFPFFVKKFFKFNLLIFRYRYLPLPRKVRGFKLAKSLLRSSYEITVWQGRDSNPHF